MKVWQKVSEDPLLLSFYFSPSDHLSCLYLKLWFFPSRKFGFGTVTRRSGTHSIDRRRLVSKEAYVCMYNNTLIIFVDEHLACVCVCVHISLIFVETLFIWDFNGCLYLKARYIGFPLLLFLVLSAFYLKTIKDLPNLNNNNSFSLVSANLVTKDSN